MSKQSDILHLVKRLNRVRVEGMCVIDLTFTAIIFLPISIANTHVIHCTDPMTTTAIYTFCVNLNPNNWFYNHPCYQYFVEHHNFIAANMNEITIASFSGINAELHTDISQCSKLRCCHLIIRILINQINLILQTEPQFFFFDKNSSSVCFPVVGYSFVALELCLIWRRRIPGMFFGPKRFPLWVQRNYIPGYVEVQL